MRGGAVVVLNAGPSSLRFGLFTPERRPTQLLCGRIERIGLPQPMMSVACAGTPLKTFAVAAPDHGAAARALLQPLSHLALPSAVAIGHRVAQHGPRFQQPRWVTPELLAELRRLRPLAGQPLLAELALIEALASRYPGVPQVACFDATLRSADEEWAIAEAVCRLVVKDLEDPPAVIAFS